MNDEIQKETPMSETLGDPPNPPELTDHQPSVEVTVTKTGTEAIPKPLFSLTEEQNQGVDLVRHWMTMELGKQEFKLGGYAGTGKTTLIKAVMEALGRDFHIEICAFTGKACSVLRRKGLHHAGTMHSLMYDCHKENGVFFFTKRARMEGDPDLVIVDEASMVSTSLYNDLKSFGKKILFVGDPGQLEPVGDNPNLMKHPDFVLSKIHRQASQSPIITLASDIRQGIAMPRTRSLDGLLIRDRQIMTSLLCEHDQVICATNKTRLSFNEKIRTFKRLPSRTVVPTDKIIVLRNNSTYNVYNGQILFIDHIISQDHLQWKVNAHDEVGNEYRDLPIWKDPFTTPQTDNKKDVEIPKIDRKPLVYADFGYAITCHKSQGSEWDKVIVIDQWMPPQVWDIKRWRYTAITRAAKHLTYCV